MGERTGEKASGQPGVDPVMTRRLKSIENVVMELSKALRGIQFYPKGHPSLSTAMNKVHSVVVQEIGDASEFSLVVSKSGFTYENNPLAPENATLKSLAREFHLRQIKKIFFLKELTPKELENFIRVIAMDAEAFRGTGKAEEYLAEGGVKHIFVNELKFGQNAGIEVDKKKEETPDVDLGAKVLSLMSALDYKTDPDEYEGAVGEIKPYFSRFIEQEKLEEAFEITSVIAEHATDDTKPDDLKKKASELLQEFPDKAFLEFLMRQLTLLDGDRKEQYEKVAVGLENIIVDACIEKLSSNEALYSLRALIQLVLELKEFSRPKIEAALLDDRWYVVRKMAFLLGEMKSAESVPALIAVASHDDMRVKKEIIKSLIKIRSTEAMKYLLSLPGSSEKEELIIFEVGLMGQFKERAVVPNLIKILKDRGRMLDNYELLAESVIALGNIGSTQAVPILEEVLNAKSFFAKANTQSLALEAANALSRITSKEALAALKRAGKHKNPEIKNAVLIGIRSQEQAISGSADDTKKGDS